ncbi:phosphoserine phosphatase SerB [Rhodobacterales bacterium HKCCE3408]|nr:phosphoserine phosphatase SerB [Rhodobacterales bacterium HKCCE3408]
MFIATLIAAPGALDPHLAEAIRNATGGGTLTWLSPDRAAEFDLPEHPSNEAELRRDLAQAQIDFAIQRAENRKKRILIADMDSTMIDQECIDELAAEAGIGAAVAEITARAMNGELDFEEALTARVGLLEGLSEKAIDRVLDSRITLASGGPALLATMRANGAHTALVSGGFTAFTGPVAARLGFDEHRANILNAARGSLTGTVARPILGREAKVHALMEIAERLGLSPDDAIAVGDGANDLGMLELAGTGVALHAKPVVQARAQIAINHGDLTALLYLQGYTDDDIVTP